MSNKRLHELYDEFEQVERTTDFEGFLVDRIAELEALNASYNCDRERHHRVIDKLETENQRLKDALVKANNNQMAAAQCASDFKYGYEKRGKEIAELEDTIKKVEAVGFEVHDSWGVSEEFNSGWIACRAQVELALLGEAK